MSPNSKSCRVSNSTAKMWFEKFPTTVALRIPRYWLGRDPGSSFEGEIMKARPWPPSLGYSGTMVKAKAVEKEGWLGEGLWRSTKGGWGRESC
ncbi:hypothetical protein Pyn_32440 [Prunus yedoensis var. nudiflora]|uniref:Uncharacterized protein n=1 Tax=Prunus yedoensis var. nudiflora TaxID=2094558 RepID=A0A314XTB2_PRUYE|nr:hypothetical protein Pyn_32440 [Prunus yedoensis var. nudiflora]